MTRQAEDELSRVTYERVRVERVRIVVETDEPQLTLPGIPEGAPLNVIDGAEARRLLNERASAEAVEDETAPCLCEELDEWGPVYKRTCPICHGTGRAVRR